ncbi:MAG: response regulator transcription factor [Candidatus Dormiibacterota bacterium]
MSGTDVATRPRLGAAADRRAEPASILIVENHEMLAEALELALSARGYSCTVARLEAGRSVLQQAAELRPQLVLLDLYLDEADGLDFVAGLRATGAKVLVVTGCNDEDHVAAALALGASGWVSKAQPFEHLLDAAEATLRNQPLIPEADYRELIERGRQRLIVEQDAHRRLAQLTARERQVLWALSEGESAGDIAVTFFVSVGTVRTHIQGILGKLGVSSQLAAVAMARLLFTPDGPPPRSN